MRVKLLRDSRINHQAGEIIEVSPAQAEFLLSVGSAEQADKPAKVEKATIEVEEVAKKAVKAPKATTKTTTKRTTTKK